ncbi:MAG: hypothetical protein NZZ41_02330 [Candidatus Dojkabacteria bacterium]|nr:hypothetical protein [Candidatus Dojkabacteria bacterium]
MQTVKLLENKARYDYQSIYAGMAKINYLFGDNPDQDDYLDNALNCLRLIGNVHIAMATYTGESDENGKLCLPVQAFEIEAVTTNTAPDWMGNSLHMQVSNLYPRGNYEKYEFRGDHIIVRPKTKVTVLYRTYWHDENGLPLVTEREAEACAYWWKWVDTRRKMYQGNQLAAQIFSIVERDKNKAINQARVPDKFSQNFLNQYMNIITSYDRKYFNRDTKTINIA